VPVAICFFLSGAAALILQVLWTRMLGHVFGATALAISTTLTVFMGGLALGSHLGGRYAPRLRRPLLAFAVLETSVGLYGLLVPTLLGFMPALLASVTSADSGFWAYAVARFGFVALILIIPTTAMGATLPILAEGVVKRSEQIASDVGRLYAANTFGAVAGAFGAGFVLIPALGITTTVYLAAAIDLFVAVAVVALGSIGGEALLLRLKRDRPDDVLHEIIEAPVIEVSSRERKLALLGFGVSGAAAMALEVLCSRLVGVVIGASTYSFTLILTTFLVGLAVGAAWMTRRIDRLRDPVSWLAAVEVIVGITAILTTAFADRLPLWLHAVARSAGVTMTQIYFTNFLIAAAVMLPATIALGAVMPLVVRIIAPTGVDHAGPIVGKAYALNTLGSIVGSFLGGFVMLPVLGVERGIHVAAATSIVLGVALAMERPKTLKRVAVVAALGAALIAFGPRWDVRSWTAGLFRMYLATNVYRDGWSPHGQVVFHEDGVATSVTVERQDDGVGVSLKVNGKVDASDIGDMPTQILSGLLPVMLHPDPKDVLVIGYGSGVTPGAVLQAPVDKVTVAEIESAVYEASNTHFAHVNHRPFDDPRASLVVDDGRNFLLRNPERRFDVIISEPSNPWMTGAASLFTQDFFAIAKSRLAKDGVFLQWLQLYELGPDNIHALIRTFHASFEYVVMFTPDPRSNDTFLVGARHPLKLDRKRLSAMLDDPALRKELERAEVRRPEDMIGLFLVGGEDIPRLVGPGPLNTDDNSLIEYAAPRDLLTFASSDPDLPFIVQMEGARLDQMGRYFVGFDADPRFYAEAARALLGQGRLKDAKRFAEEARLEGADVTFLRRMIGYVDEADSQAVVVADATTKDDENYVLAAYTMMRGNDRDALAILESEDGVEDKSLAHRFLYAFLCYRRDRFIDATYLIEKVVNDDTFVAANPSVLYYAGRITYYDGQYRDGLEYFERFDAATQDVDAAPPP
jgi:spermidine synthase